MEPIEWIVGLILIFGGIEVMDEEDNVDNRIIEEVVHGKRVSDDPVYERGIFFKSQNGYFITNLTPEPVDVEGCDSQILVADLSEKRNSEVQLSVTEVEMMCEA